MRTPLTLALLLTAGALGAQDINGGIHTGLSLPMGDLNDKDDFGTNQIFGAHFGGHLDFNITTHHQVRAQLTYHTFPGSRWGSGVKNDYHDFQGGADWVYNFDNPGAGWYVLAGAHINNFKVDYDAPGFSGSASQSGKFGVRGGGGYNFSRAFSLEGHLNQVNVEKFGSDGFGFDTATWVQVSAVFRFGH
jgi:hypothetical protein